MRDLIRAYRMRWKRRRYLWRAFRSRHDLEIVNDLTPDIKPKDILLFGTIRDELFRLPHFLSHYRKIGVDHFLFVDNGSTDGSVEFLEAQPDVSLWSTDASYKSSRFGMDWINHLLRKYGSGHWCVTVDADEILVYHDWENTDLRNLAARMSDPMLGAVMLDLYPKGRIGDHAYLSGEDPLSTLKWFDPPDFTAKRQPLMKNLWVQGGVRRRVFFSDNPERSPTLNKIPFVKWRRGYVYVNSTHSMLPRHLNGAYLDFANRRVFSGVLLHNKFLNKIVARSRIEKARGEHFGDGSLFAHYYDALSENPELWFDGSVEYEGWQQLEKLGLMKGLD